jgi:hypothetical protein
LFNACSLSRDGAATPVPVTTFEGLERSAVLRKLRFKLNELGRKLLALAEESGIVQVCWREFPAGMRLPQNF